MAKRERRDPRSHKTWPRKPRESFDNLADKAQADQQARQDMIERSASHVPFFNSLAELGFPEGATGEDILRRLKEMGIKFPPDNLE